MKDFATQGLEIAKEVGTMALKLPFRVWNAIPPIGRYAIYFTILGIMVAIIIYIIVNREEIMQSIY
jgi:hypothetical protein